MVAHRDMILGVLSRSAEQMRALGVRRLGLFGSVAEDIATEASDLDFVVEFDRPSFDSYMDLKFFLEDTFGCPVDLVLTSVIKPRLRDRILKQARYVQGF